MEDADDGELEDDGLAAAGGRRHHHRAVGVEDVVEDGRLDEVEVGELGEDLPVRLRQLVDGPQPVLGPGPRLEAAPRVGVS